jgi:RNA 3''-terminal phosphate cyclase
MATIVDGSQGEGGGQIIRNAIVYATLFQQSLHIHSVRAQRNTPGLRAQHKCSLEIAAEICGGKLMGANIGSCSFDFHPAVAADAEDIVTSRTNDSSDSTSSDGADNCKKTLVMDIGTAGSICLLLQVGLPCWIFNSSKVKLLELRGGTNASLAPQIDYMVKVFLPTISTHCFGLQAEEDIARIDIKTRGYYPIGKGVVKCMLHPTLETLQGALQPIRLTERGHVVSVSIQCFYAGKVPRFVASRMANAALNCLKNAANHHKKTGSMDNIQPTIDIIKHEQAVGSASGILIVAKTDTNCIFGASALGNRKEKPDRTGEIAAQELLDDLKSGGCVDAWLQDQLIIFMALAQGESKVRTGCLTLHTRTAIDVACQMTKANFEVVKIESGHEDETSSTNVKKSGTQYGEKGCIPGQHMIICQGIGFRKNKENK